MKKKLSILCSSYPPERGAAPSRIYRLATMLAAKGYEVHVICAMPNYPTGKIFPAYRKKFIVHEQIGAVSLTRIWMIPTHSSSKVKRSISILSYSFSLLTVAFFQITKHKPDLLIVSTPPFVTGFWGMLIAKVLKRKTVLNVSDIWPQSVMDLGFIKEGFFYRFLRKLEQKMYGHATAFSVQSLEIKKHIEQNVSDKPIFLYRNLQPQIASAQDARVEGKRKIVYAGLLGIAQGVYAIIDTINFSELNTELHIYGQGFEQQKIQDWIKSNPQAAVYYHGSVEAKEVPNLLTQFHAMLIPLSASIYGAVPSKIFNALANALPILFCGSGEASEIVSNYEIGFVNAPNDMQQLKRNIETFIALSDKDYALLRKKCLEASEAEFNKEKQDAAFLAFLDELIKA